MSEINVLWIGKYNQEWTVSPHRHVFFQMIGVVKGMGTATADTEKLKIEKESICIFPPGCIHGISNRDREEALKILDIKFEVSDQRIYNDMLKLGNRAYIADFSWFLNKFDELIEESTEKNKYYYDRINAIFFSALVRIIRENLYSDSKFPESLPETDHFNKQAVCGIDIDKLLKYIDANYSNTITLDDLSRLAVVNKTMLICAFKKLFHTTPIQYINQLRLQKSKELLVNTGMSVTEISQLSGFQSIHYFSRYFKEKENCTPYEYRIRNSENRFFKFSESYHALDVI